MYKIDFLPKIQPFWMKAAFSSMRYSHQNPIQTSNLEFQILLEFIKKCKLFSKINVMMHINKEIWSFLKWEICSIEFRSQDNIWKSHCDCYQWNLPASWVIKIPAAAYFSISALSFIVEQCSNLDSSFKATCNFQVFFCQVLFKWVLASTSFHFSHIQWNSMASVSKRGKINSFHQQFINRLRT